MPEFALESTAAGPALRVLENALPLAARALEAGAHRVNARRERERERRPAEGDAAIPAPQRSWMKSTWNRARKRSTILQLSADHRDQTLAKSYLRFLVEQIIVHGNEIEIRGKTSSAVALLASASNSDLTMGTAAPETVLVSVGDWLRK